MHAASQRESILYYEDKPRVRCQRLGTKQMARRGRATIRRSGVRVDKLRGVLWTAIRRWLLFGGVRLPVWLRIRLSLLWITVLQSIWLWRSFDRNQRSALPRLSLALLPQRILPARTRSVRHIFHAQRRRNTAGTREGLDDAHGESADPSHRPAVGTKRPRSARALPVRRASVFQLHGL